MCKNMHPLERSISCSNLARRSVDCVNVCAKIYRRSYDYLGKWKKGLNELKSSIFVVCSYDCHKCSIAPIAIQTVKNDILFRRIFVEPLNIIFDQTMAQQSSWIVPWIQITQLGPIFAFNFYKFFEHFHRYTFTQSTLKRRTCTMDLVGSHIVANF